MKEILYRAVYEMVVNFNNYNRLRHRKELDLTSANMNRIKNVRAIVDRCQN